MRTRSCHAFERIFGISGIGAIGRPTMTDVDRLFEQFIDEHLTGSDPDPWSFIDRLEGPQREELADLIDAYYVGAPRRQWSAEGFRDSSAERTFRLLQESLEGEAGLWPVVLPRL